MKKTFTFSLDTITWDSLEEPAKQLQLSKNQLVAKLVEDYTKGENTGHTFKQQIEEARLNLILAQIAKNKEQTRVYAAEADILESGRAFSKNRKELQNVSNQISKSNDFSESEWDRVYSQLITTDFNNHTYICNTCRTFFQILGEARKHCMTTHGNNFNDAVNSVLRNRYRSSSNDLSGVDTGYGY